MTTHQSAHPEDAEAASAAEGEPGADAEKEFLGSAQEYSAKFADEFPSRFIVPKSTYESTEIRLALAGIIATFFTWGCAYVFEYIANPDAVYLAAFLFFFGTLILLLTAFGVLRTQRGRIPYLRRSETNSTIELLDQQKYSK